MIAGKLTCPHCDGLIELSTTKAPQQQPTKSTSKSDVGAMLSRIEDAMMCGWSPDDSARDFIAKTRERYDQYGERTIFSEKQLSFLKSLDAKAGVD